MTHKAGMNQFLSFKVTEDGINTFPVTSVAGSFFGNDAFVTGMLKVSPAGNKLAISNFSINTTYPPNPAYDLPSYIDMFDFNALTGAVSNTVLVDSFSTFFQNALGICFSPDGTKLYATNPFFPIYTHIGRTGHLSV